MKIKLLRKRLGRTIQPKMYNSITFMEDMEVEVEPNETFEEVEQKLYDLVHKMLSNDIQRWRDASKNVKKETEKTDD